MLVVGFDPVKKFVFIHNPSSKYGPHEVSFACFDEARTSYGTDEDVIFVYQK